MPRFINTLHGIVWAEKNGKIEIQLPRGGKILAPKTAGIHIGDHVTFLMDTSNREITQVIPKEEADTIVKRGSNHIFDTALRDMPLRKEECNGKGYAESGDVLWCPELGQHGANN